MIELTRDLVKKALEAAVAERGSGYVYKPENPPMRRSFDGGTMCYYVHSDKDGREFPGCIAGNVLHRLGVTLHELKQHETTAVSSILENSDSDIEWSYDSRHILDAAQSNQDAGDPWGVAVANALGAVDWSRPEE